MTAILQTTRDTQPIHPTTPSIHDAATACNRQPSNADRYASQPHKEAYRELLEAPPGRTVRHRSMNLLASSLAQVGDTQDDLPQDPRSLLEWMDASARKSTGQYQDYLASRRAGAPRRYFHSRAHALYFLQAVAPTKLVDGSWLYSLLQHSADARLHGLIQTYLEELGNGDASKNHVVLYRSLLRAHGLNQGEHLPDEFFVQGAIQLALGHAGEEMLPEIIGFNLGYEQLPLHLLITSYELNELGIDPYYFTLHVTVDNADSGHARKAVDSVLDNASRHADAGEYWRRVRAGYRLNDLGLGTSQVIQDFDIDAEVLRIFTAKAMAGQGAHSDYCRIDGRTVNEWLALPDGMASFLAALERKGWIVRNAPPQDSRFWRLLQGERAEMFGVFSDYELQVVFDWLRGDASADGCRYDTPWTDGQAPRRCPSFRAMQRASESTARVLPTRQASPLRLANAPTLRSLSPAMHWTPEGLAATRAWMATN